MNDWYADRAMAEYCVAPRGERVLVHGAGAVGAPVIHLAREVLDYRAQPFE